GLEQLDERIVLGLHEVLPTQHRKLRPRLGLPGRGLGPGLAPFEQRRSAERAGGKRAAAFDKSAAGQNGHGVPPWVVCLTLCAGQALSRSPVTSSNRCTKRA